MQELIKSIQDGKLPNPQQLKHLVNETKKARHKEFEAYNFWIEFLKRSNNYKATCEWINPKKLSHPYPGITDTDGQLAPEMLDFIFFSHTILKLYAVRPRITLSVLVDYGLKNLKKNSTLFVGEFFKWAFDAGFPYDDEMLMNYLVFGDVFNPSPLAKFFFDLRVSFLIQLNDMANVYELHETIDATFLMAEKMAEKELGRKPNLDEFKESLSGFLTDEPRLHITIRNPFNNKDEIINRISDMIESRRSKTENLYFKHKKEHDFFEPNRFELPGSNLREDELKRYLKVYDLKSNGKKTKEIVKTVYKNYPLESIDSATRMTLRDLQKARKIIKNVEMGFFPGKF
jgi:hypothetical protein